MKKRIKAVGTKIKWFNSRNNQHQQNRMFVNNQRQFFQRLNDEEENHQYGHFGGVYGVKGRNITSMLNG